MPDIRVLFQTGTGFIAVDNAKGMSFNLAPDKTTDCHASSHGNPATNDWIPAANDMVNLESSPYKEFDQPYVGKNKDEHNFLGIF